MNSNATVPSRQERVPHRWHMLQLLRLMRLGHPFIRFLDMSCATHLEGFPLAVHYFDFLERNGYIAPCAEDGWMANYYVLTAEGIDLHEQGEQWWGSLNWREKYWVIWRG